MRRIFSFFFFLSIHFSAIAQPDSTDNLSNNKFDRQYLSLRNNIVPAGLIVSSLVVEFSGIKKRWQEKIPDTHTDIEDYLQ
ncbi:MAG TPA: hypothetical protein VI583_05515, partial [Cyclobacteriaceae bacterium]|nr:hypothetical protein [Cyclobacteriaceae bacterium]